MPQFFFDCFDGEAHLIDDHGIVLQSESEARDHAVVLAQALLSEDVAEREVKIVSVTVRASRGLPIYVAQCAFTGCWMKGRQPEV